MELVISPTPNQSRGGVAMPQTLAGVSSSTPTCCNSRELCDGRIERTRARIAGGAGSTFSPTTWSVTQVPTPYSCREGYRQPCRFTVVETVLSTNGSPKLLCPKTISGTDLSMRVLRRDSSFTRFSGVLARDDGLKSAPWHAAWISHGVPERHVYRWTAAARCGPMRRC